MAIQSLRKTWNKEWEATQRAERRLERAAQRDWSPGWKTKLEEKVPEKAEAALEGAFTKAFALVFEKGTGVIEKTYRREELQQDYARRDHRVQAEWDRKALVQFRRDSRAAETKDLLLTTAEGVGLGVLGIGLPDILLFVSLLLRGIYAAALRYGYDDRDPAERLLILKMMEASLSKGEDWKARNGEIEAALGGSLPAPEAGELDRQLRRTARAFAGDMLLLKFVQGLPLIGVLGGAGNPVYYRRVVGYVRLKYHRRYLTQRKRGKQTP